MREDYERRLLDFVRQRFLDAESAAELDETSPLLEWGVIDSLKIAILLGFIRDELGVTVPFQYISSRNFGDVRSIAALTCELAESSAELSAESRQ